MVRIRSGRRIVVVGGGAGGLELVTRLGRRWTDKVILVDRLAGHVWKPRLHEVAAGLLGPGEDETSYLAHGRAHGFDFVMGELTGLDLAQRTIQVARLLSPESGAEILGERTIAYDILVLSLGSRVNDFGVPGVLDHCHMLDTPLQAQRLQHRFLEAAVQVSAGRCERLRVGIVGAGATGVELAAELHHAAHAMQHYGGLGADGRLDITLLDQAPRVLSAADPRTSARVQDALEKLGVKVRLAEAVTSVDNEAFHLKGGDAVACTIKVWASGVTGLKVVSKLQGLSIGRGGRIIVEPNLACVGAEEVFALGDCATALDDQARPLWPPTAQVAHQQATYLSKTLRPGRSSQRPIPFRYEPKGFLVSLGANDAAAEFPKLGKDGPAPSAGGALAKLLYVSLFHMHRLALHGPVRAMELALADAIRRMAIPPIKLH